MQLWFSLVPVNEFTARLPGAMAIALAGGGLVILGRQISSAAIALAAGLVFAVLPLVTWSATEARVAAMTMAAAVWLSVACISAIRRDRAGPWLLYALSLAGAGVLHALLLLMIPVHAVAVWFHARIGGRWQFEFTQAIRSVRVPRGVPRAGPSPARAAATAPW